MLKLYGARENIDKERFIYENIVGETLVIVPNQYTLVAEEQALMHLGTKCLYDVEILSMNRLGLRVMTEQGKESVKMLDKYGRFMLLTKIIKAHKDELTTFAKSAGKMTFTSMVNDFISDFKQQDCKLGELRDMLGGDADETLKDKLVELGGIFAEYESAIEGAFTDSEDYIAMYIDAIKDSKWLEGKTVWIYGYDSVTPKFINAMVELANKCKGVNFIVNESDCGLHEILVKEIQKYAGNVQVTPIVAEACHRSRTIETIESSLFNDDAMPVDWEPEDLTVVRAANPYYEAESAAVYIYHLIRDLGYKMRDIQIIANDEGVMQPIVRRTLEEYGLPVFMDKAREITDAAVVSFIVNLLKFARYKKTEDLMSMLKSGYAGLDRDEVSELENYANRFHIKFSMWDRPFKYGAEQFGEEAHSKIESMRAKLSAKIASLNELASDTTWSRFVVDLKAYLDSEWNLSNTVVDMSRQQADMTYYEEAQRTAESYKSAIELLGQIEQIMGDEAFDLAEFIDIYVAGLADVEVGVIPKTVDGLSMGTMIRTRPRNVKAVVVLGANEGTLPLEPSTEGLFSVDEKAYFKQKGWPLGALDDIKMAEESVAMYRMMSLPTEKLYVSYSMTDAAGKDQAPSEIIDSLQSLFSELKIQKDVIEQGWGVDMFESRNSGMRHLVKHLKDKNAPKKMDDLTQAAISWYENNDIVTLNDMLKAAMDENDPKAIGARVATSLYSRRDGNLVLSASSISSYHDCPFKFFIDKGIKPEEERKFESDPRSIGDVYHECLMEIARKIVQDKSYGEQLINSSDEELESIIARELDKIATTYQGGLFISSGTEEYRMERIKEICSMAVRELANQLASESVEDATFETDFGRGKRFAPLEFDVDGNKVYVEGKIDRADILTGDKVRIVDYKTGKDRFDPWKVSKGYKMQLMIYMISATTGNLEPAGMFYFNIEDPIQGLNDKGKLKEDNFKLRGRYIDEPGMLDLMPKEALTGRDIKMSRVEYDALKEEVLEKIGEIANGIAGGKIGIRPLKPSNTLVCNFCQYKAICKRDREYVKNAARAIPAKPKKEEE